MTTIPPIPRITPVTVAQRIRLLELAGVMRTHAVKVGPLHSWWEDISDMEAVAQGKPSRLGWSAEMWEDEAERSLSNVYTEVQLRVQIAHWRSGVYNGRPAVYHPQNDGLAHMLGALPTWLVPGMKLGEIVDRWAAERA